MEKIDPYLKYLNIVLIVIILSTLIILYVFLSGINLFYAPNLEIWLLILPCVFGGMVAGYITSGMRSILSGMIIGALSLCIWSSIYIALLTLITSNNPVEITLLIFWIPGTLGIGGILGIIGGFIGLIIKKASKMLLKGQINPE